MRSLAKFLPALAVFGTVTVISAAPATTLPPATNAGAGSSASAAPPPVVLSGPDMQLKVTAIQTQLEADSEHVARLKDAAKKQTDVIKLNCVNDRMVQLKAERNIADAAAAQVEAAIAKNSDDRQGLFLQYQAVGERVRQLREEASNCVGENELSKQESGVDVVHPDFPDDPTAGAPFAPGVEAPGYASPYD